jgi:ATP-dependent DNA helicase Rep
MRASSCREFDRILWHEQGPEPRRFYRVNIALSSMRRPRRARQTSKLNTMSAGLNAAQSEAVRYLDGPCLVLAGAGSGKTRVITQKIAHLIEGRGFEPKHIAALTFTNKAALEMRERTAKLLEGKTLTTPGKEGRKIPVNQLTISTFHSLGVQIMRQEAEHVGLKPQFSIMDSDDCFGMVQEQLGTTDKGLIRKIQSIISLWKNAMVSPDHY